MRTRAVDEWPQAITRSMNSPQPDVPNSNPRRRTVLAAMHPGSTYIYFEVRTVQHISSIIALILLLCLSQGCPTALGCSVVLRGAEKPQLRAIKAILRFRLSKRIEVVICSILWGLSEDLYCTVLHSVMLAYHLRLEVAYYTDRYVGAYSLHQQGAVTIPSNVISLSLLPGALLCRVLLLQWRDCPSGVPLCCSQKSVCTSLILTDWRYL